jgi:hypothetical protein
MPAKNKYTNKEFELENDPFALTDLFHAMQEGSDKHTKHPEHYIISIAAKEKQTGNLQDYYVDPAREKVLTWLKKMWNDIDSMMLQIQQQPIENKMRIEVQQQGVDAGSNLAWSVAIWETLLEKHYEEQELSSNDLKKLIKEQWLPYLDDAVHDYTFFPPEEEQDKQLHNLFTNMQKALMVYTLDEQKKIETEDQWYAEQDKEEKEKFTNLKRKQQEESEEKALQADAKLLINSAYKAYPIYVVNAVAELQKLCDRYATNPVKSDTDKIKLINNHDEGIQQINQLSAILNDEDKSPFKKLKTFNQYYQQNKGKILNSHNTNVKSFGTKIAKICAVFFATVAGLFAGYFTGKAAYKRLFPQNYFLGKVNKIYTKTQNATSQKNNRSSKKI